MTQLRKLPHLIARISTTCLVLLAGVWAAGVLFYRLPTPQIFRITLATVFILASLFVVWSIWHERWKAAATFFVAVGLVGFYWNTINPSLSRNWAPDVGRMAWVETADRVTIHNVRNFEWKTDNDFIERWEDRSYDLSKLKTVNVFLSYWNGDTIAHVIISFGFDTPAGIIEQVAFSFEARKQVGQAYSSTAGFFKENELIGIAADERDVIRVRAVVRGEDVRQYRLNVTPVEARAWFNDYVKELNELASIPKFYNTLTTNCTTVIFRMAKHLDPRLQYSWRILLTGHLPEYLYQINAVDTSIPFSELQLKARVSIKSAAAGDTRDYSRLIRLGLPIPQANSPRKSGTTVFDAFAK